MKKYDDDLEFGSLNEDSRDYRFIVPIIIVAVLLVIVIAALILIGKNGKNKDTSADPVATEQSGTTEEEAQNTEVMGAVEATESAEETDADDPQGSSMMVPEVRMVGNAKLMVSIMACLCSILSFSSLKRVAMTMA